MAAMHAGMPPMAPGGLPQYPSYGQMAGVQPAAMPQPVGMPAPYGMPPQPQPQPGFAPMPGQMAPVPMQGAPMMPQGAAPGSFMPPMMAGPRGPTSVQRAMPGQMPLPAAPTGLAPAALAQEGLQHDIRDGDLVKLKGQAAYPHLEGQTLKVEKADCGDGTGNVMIRLEGRKFGFVDPSFLEKVGEDPSHGQEQMAPAQPQGPEFAAGDRVQIINLEARPQHNGKTAVVHSCTPMGIRVQLEDMSQGAVVLDLKPGYLSLIERGTLGAAAGGAPEAGGVVEGGPAAGAGAGSTVRIVGLASRPQHNGRLARVEVPNSGGNVIVSLVEPLNDGVTKLAVSPAYLEPAEGLQPGAAPGGAHWLTQGMQQQMRVGNGMMPQGQPSTLQQGQKVMLNMPQQPQHHGRAGVVDGMSPDGAVAVTILDAMGNRTMQMRVPPQHLQPLG